MVYLTLDASQRRQGAIVSDKTEYCDEFSLERILRAYVSHGYKIFDKEHDLNIFGIRSPDMTSNTFNDVVGVFYKSEGEWKIFKTAGTTDAGLYYRENPMNVSGTAIIAPGQHVGVWRLGKHQGKYDALVQYKPILLYRDADRTNALEYKGEPKAEMAGINFHRANANTTSKQVDKWSAGCVVVADPSAFQFILDLARKQAQTTDDSFTFTLFEANEIV